jgi:hypothetical protein
VLEGWLLFPDQSFQCRDSVARFNLNVEDTIDFIALHPAPQLDLIRHVDDRGPLLLVEIRQFTATSRSTSTPIRIGLVPSPCFTADRGGYNLFAYALAILLHIYNSLINMRYLHILPHI